MNGPARENAIGGGATPGPSLSKTPTGIAGLDELTGGGLPRGRATLVCGGAGCGKTLLAVQFLVNGATRYDEPGVLMSFEESEAEIAANVRSLGLDVPGLVAAKRLALDTVRVSREELGETGEYDLEGLFVRLQLAIEAVGAKRVVLDTLEALFSAMPSAAVVRAELRRLLRWLKDRGMTVIFTGESGQGTLTRDGLEEYVSDCVISLDHRIADQVSTRRLRVVKYRGSTHGTNEYPFLIDEAGISVVPITSLGLEHPALGARISTGLPRLDEMLGGEGYFAGSTVLVSGTAGSGKTSLAAHLADETCRAGRRCLFLVFEESAAQVARNMRSIGLDLDAHAQSGALRMVATRPYAHGLEMHLVAIHRAVEAFAPDVVVVDPITSLLGAGPAFETRAMLTRLIDLLKSRGVTALFTSLTGGGDDLETTDVGVSSLIDTWIMLEVVRSGGERNRVLNIVKARGMGHSNQASEYRITGEGIALVDTYLGADGVLTGSARVAREAEERRAADARAAELARLTLLRESRRRAFEGQVKVMREEFAAADAELARALEEAGRASDQVGIDRATMAKSRSAFLDEAGAATGEAS